MNKIIFVSALVFLFILSACNPQKMLSKRLVGEWAIVSYEERNREGANPTMTNIGTITFNNDMTGTKAVSYSIMQVAYLDDKPFQWENTENTVTLDGEESDFAKVWFIQENKKTTQEWRSTDSEGNVQIMRLRR
ncbi:MAG: hypothetical protein R6W71_13195 [Bacteroidales bacterium]|jgi:hypothetical protein